ncbi:MAG: RDD family protein [Gammaproteobacteria bacterium]|nr:RDD family protein [Gammaproteobacteria bacterium]
MNGSGELASRIRRLSATLLDLGLVFCFGLVLLLVTGWLEDAEDFAGGGSSLTIPLLGIMSFLILNGWLLWNYSQTIGKRITGIRIVTQTVISDPDDEVGKVTFWKLLIRSVFFLLIFASFSFFLILVLVDHLWIFGKKKQCLHDLILGTSVIRLK